MPTSIPLAGIKPLGLIEGNYRIIYKIVDPEKIDVLTIHHSARDLYRRKI